MTEDSGRALGIENAERLLKGIIIPPRPSVLLKVLDEQRKREPDLHRIAELIAGDVALAAGTLKVVNSPFFGLRRKVRSVAHAVNLLGVGNVVNIVTGLMLHTAFGGNRGAFMEAFWNASNRLALTCALVARTCTNLAPDEMYTLGLFLDCGVPMLERKFNQYAQVYTEGLQTTDHTVTEYEDSVLGTDHATVGYLVAKSWQLPNTYSQCILRHHDVRDYYSEQHPAVGEMNRALAVVVLAMHLHRIDTGLSADPQWRQIGAQVLGFLGLTEEDVATLSDQNHQALLAYAAD